MYKDAYVKDIKEENAVLLIGSRRELNYKDFSEENFMEQLENKFRKEIVDTQEIPQKKEHEDHLWLRVKLDDNGKIINIKK